MDPDPRPLTIHQLDARQDEVLAQLEALERQIDRLLGQLRPETPAVSAAPAESAT